MNRIRLSLFWLIAAAWLCFAGNAAFAQAPKLAPDDSIKFDKVTFLYPLSTFVQRSESKVADKLIIGILGKDPFEGEDAKGQGVNHLDAMVRESNARKGKDKRRKIEIQRFDTKKKYQPCHMLFVSAISATNLPADTPMARLKDALDIAKLNKDTTPVLVV